MIGNYQIVRQLGEGGMGVVYLGQHTLLGRRAAIKVLLPELSARPDIVNRFFNEARAVTSISDPGIVQVFDFGYHTDGSAFIVMEFLEGETLDRRLARLGRLPVYEALRLSRQIAASLAAAHAQHIIHRDLKPENIFLVPDGEVASGERSKILDFGIAKLSDEHPGKIKTSTGALMGTPLYMSPEQCRGLSELDHRSDIYALACVLFHLLTGRPPFEGEGMGDIIAAHIREPAPLPSSRMPDIPPAVDALVMRCLAKAPADRYQTMVELATAIGQILPLLTSPEAPTRYMYAYPGGNTPVPAAGYGSHPGTPPPPPPGYGSRPGTPPPPSPGYASRPGTPAPPPPHPSYPAHPSHPPQASYPQASYPAMPVQPMAATPVPAVSTKPTTLGSSVGQVATVRPASKLPWLITGLAVMCAAGIGIGVVVTRQPAGRPGGPGDAGISAPPVAIDAASIPTGAIDAGVVVVPDAAPDAAAPDAALPDAAPPPIDAAPRRPPHHPPPPHVIPHNGSGSGTTPPGCDRSIDSDCDGIPDVR